MSNITTEVKIARLQNLRAMERLMVTMGGKDGTIAWLNAMPADASNKIHGTWWLCRCSCGNERIVPRNWIISQHTKSCGCLKRGRKTGTMFKQTEQKILKIRKAKEESEKQKTRIATSCEQLAYECVCPFCGETFERLSNAWAYKIKIGSRLYWLCSWRCLHKVKYEKQGLRVVEA